MCFGNIEHERRSLVVRTGERRRQRRMERSRPPLFSLFLLLPSQCTSDLRVPLHVPAPRHRRNADVRCHVDHRERVGKSTCVPLPLFLWSLSESVEEKWVDKLSLIIESNEEGTRQSCREASRKRMPRFVAKWLTCSRGPKRLVRPRKSPFTSFSIVSQYLGSRRNK